MSRNAPSFDRVASSNSTSFFRYGPRSFWVHYFDWHYGSRHFKAEPLSFGTLRSRLFAVLADKNHEKVALEPGELRALKAWIDLNCPLWPDYRHRANRPR